MMSAIRADLLANVDRTRHSTVHYWVKVLGKLLVTPQVHAVLLYRFSSGLARTPLRPLAFVVRSLGLVWSGAEIHPDARIGAGLALVHSHGVVIGAGVRIGVDCRVSQGVTMGEPGRGSSSVAEPGFPTVGDHVTLGAHAVLVGHIIVGDRAVVGANAVVVKDVEAGWIVAGNPAVPIRPIGIEHPHGREA